MAGRKTNGKQRDAHLATVARLYLDGMPQYEIATATDRSQGQISRDLQALRLAWRASAIVDMDEVMGQQLERLDWMEREARLAWEASKQQAVEEFTEQADVPTGQTTVVGGQTVPVTQQRRKAAIRRKQRTGHSDYLAQYLAAVQERSKLLGLYPAEKRDVMVSAGGGISLDLIEKIRQRKRLAEERAAIEATGTVIE